MQRAVHCSRLSCAAPVWFGRSHRCPQPPRQVWGENKEVEEMRGKEEDLEPGEWVSGLSDDFRRGWEVLPAGRPARLSAGACSPPPSPPSPHPSPPLNLSQKALNPSPHPLSHSPLNSPRFRSLASFSRSCRMSRGRKKPLFSAPDGAGVVAGLVSSAVGAGGAVQWPARAGVAATT